MKKEYGICKCCGGTITSDQSNTIFWWFCEDEIIGKRCKNYGKEKMNCENCPLDKNEEIKKERNRLQNIIREEIIKILNKYEICITNHNTEILRSLYDLIGKGINIYEETVAGNKEYIICKVK